MPSSLTYAEWPVDVYLIGYGRKPPGLAHADASLEDIGYKVFDLLGMLQSGLPVSPAFVFGTGYGRSDAMWQFVTECKVWAPGLQQIELAFDRRSSDARAPPLLAVRSGAAVSMPGMLETLLNIGLCDATLSDLLRQTGNPRLVWGTCWRLVVSYGEAVEGIAPQIFETEYSMVAGAADEAEQLDFAQLCELTRRSLRAYAQAVGRSFPQDPETQLAGATQVALVSRNTQKARAYRHQYQIDKNIGTAVTVQGMVFGNGGGNSSVGAGFTRNPATDEPVTWVDFFFDAQDEDVVSGRRRMQGYTESARTMSRLWETLCKFGSCIERTFGSMQDFEFIVQDARLYLLRTRNGKRTLEAVVRIAPDLLDEGIIEAATAQERTVGIDPAVLVRHRIVFDDGNSPEPLTHTMSACSGVAAGEIALDETATRARQTAGVPVTLARSDAQASDLTAIQVISGLFIQHGARTSRAAVVACQFGRACLIGCEALRVHKSARVISLGETTPQEGDSLTLDGDDGSTYTGEFSVVTEPLTDLWARLARLRTGGTCVQSHDQRPSPTPSTCGSRPASAAAGIRKLLQVALQRVWVEDGLSLRRNSNVSYEGTRSFA